MKHRVYTLWAAMKGEQDFSPWMVAAEDEFSWQGDPDRCERVFQTARNLCDRNNWAYREVELSFDYNAVARCFESGEVDAEVEA